MAEQKNGRQPEEIYRGDFTAEELAERRRIAQMARAGAAPARKRKKKRSLMQRYGVLLFLASFVLIMSALITWVLDMPVRAQKAASLSALQAQQQAANSAAALGVTAHGPAQQTESYTITPVDMSVMTQKENGRVDLSYFDDALFIGDSLTQGFQLYENGLQNARHAAYIGVTPKGIIDGSIQKNYNNQEVTAMDEIMAAPVTKIYILLGTNALPTLTDEAFIKYYNDMLDVLAEKKAGCTFYIQAIPPVSAAKAAADSNFSKERIQGLNTQLAQIAWSRGMHYIDLYSALADENGDLRADLLIGEFHLENAGYGVWRDYLMTHTVYSPKNTYIAGSPAYKA